MRQWVHARVFVWRGNRRKAKRLQRRASRQKPMPPAVGILMSSFNDDAESSYQSCSARRPECAARAAEKFKQREPKKFKKKLVRAPRVPLEGNFDRQMSLFCRSKKVQKR